MRGKAWLAVALLAVSAPASFAAEPIREWVFPALVYGASSWSLIRVTNKGTAAAELNLEAFSEKGEPAPVSPLIHVEPGATKEVRLQPPGAGGGWARLSGPKDATKAIKVEAVTEYLSGNKIEWIARDPISIESGTDRVLSPPDNAYLYILNSGNEPLKTTICWTPRSIDLYCQQSTASPAHVVVQPKAALFGSLGKSKARFFIVRADKRQTWGLMFFTPAKGSIRTFSTESTLSFDDDVDARPADKPTSKK